MTPRRHATPGWFDKLRDSNGAGRPAERAAGTHPGGIVDYTTADLLADDWPDELERSAHNEPLARPRREVARGPEAAPPVERWDAAAAGEPAQAVPFPAAHNEAVEFTPEAPAAPAEPFSQPWHAAVPPAAEFAAPAHEPPAWQADWPQPPAAPYTTAAEPPSAEVEPPAAWNVPAEPVSPLSGYESGRAAQMHDDSNLTFEIGRRLREIAAEVAALAEAVGEIEQRQQQREQAVNNVLSQIVALSGQLRVASQAEAVAERGDTAWPDAPPDRAASQHAA
jgi:hypothetical protein